VHALVTPGYSELLFYLAVGMFIFSNSESLVLQLTRSEVDEHIGSIFLPRWKQLNNRIFNGEPRLFHSPYRQFALYSFFLVIAISLLAAFLLYLALPRQAVEGCPMACATNLERRAGPLRVLSLNMLHGYPEFEDLSLRLDLIASEIRRLDADVVLLQEVPWTKETGSAAVYLAQQLGYNYLYYRANGSRQLIQFEEGEAILSRFSLSKPLFTALEPRAGSFENRVVLGATAATPLGEMAFYVAHLTDRDPAQNHGQAESLKAFVEDHQSGPALVAGDFNAREDSPQISELSGQWMDAYRNFYPNSQGFTCCIDDLASGPEETLKKRIDYIFLVSNEEISGEIISIQHVFDQPFSVEGGWQWASDHNGLMLEFEP
jgi:endonuclease/exonuclease/phosphatase family metal-dependent hydrolase